MDLTQQVDWTPRWFASGGTLHYRLQAPLRALSLTQVVHTLLFPLHLLEQSELQDLRGRGSQQQLLQGPGIAANSFELMRLDGSFLALAEDEASEALSVRIMTPFQCFASGNHIVHSLQREQSHVELQGLPAQCLGFVMPVRPEFFRLGFAMYMPARAGLFGVSPEVQEELYIDCSATEFSLELKSRALSKKNEMPSLQGLFEWLRLGLAGLFGVELQDQLSSLQ
ncbi:MAG: hypothetical protein KDD62_04920 [Bdellovibrionales bacterium]|nr:hypothetical protein [Bdellovibrionales bacterium]